jgi:hypothetical protein
MLKKFIFIVIINVSYITSISSSIYQNDLLQETYQIEININFRKLNKKIFSQIKRPFLKKMEAKEVWWVGD